MLKPDACGEMKAWLSGQKPFSELGPGSEGLLPDGPGWAVAVRGESLVWQKQDLLGRVTRRFEAQFLLRLRLPFSEGDEAGAAAFEQALVQVFGLALGDPPPFGEEVQLAPPRQLRIEPPTGDGTRQAQLMLPVQFTQTTEI